MTTPREILKTVDDLRHVADRARKLSATMGEERPGAIEIGRMTLIKHRNYPADLALIDAMRKALDDVADEHYARAGDLEATVTVVEVRP